MKVALLGLGTMGGGMARNLIGAGIELNVWNRTHSKTQAFKDMGAAAMATPAEAAADVEVVISMLADDNASRSAWLGENGAFSTMKAGTIAVDCGTVSPAWIAEMQKAGEAHGIEVIDAPVTGSRPQADAGQLIFLVGAQPASLERVRPVLKTMSKEILYLGPVGSGAQMKLINNYLCGVQTASFAEALAWIERSGLNRDQALEFLKRAAPGSPILAAVADRMTQRTYEVFFLLRLMAKDLRYARNAAAEFGVALRTGEASEALFMEAEQQGYADRDMAAVAEVPRASGQR